MWNSTGRQGRGMEWASVTVVAIGPGVFWASVLCLIVALTGTAPQA